MLPTVFVDVQLLVSIVVGQRKLHTLTLQHVVGGKIIDKIVERLVGLYGLRLFRQFFLVD